MARHGEGGNKPPGCRLLLSRMAAIDDKLSLKSGTAGLRNILFHCRTGGILVFVLNGRKAIPGSGIFQGNQAGIDSANQIAATAARRSKSRDPRLKISANQGAASAARYPFSSTLPLLLYIRGRGGGICTCTCEIHGGGAQYPSPSPILLITYNRYKHFDIWKSGR